MLSNWPQFSGRHFLLSCRDAADEQVYLHFNMEPPTKLLQILVARPNNTNKYRQHHNFGANYFNFSMSYSREADFNNPYARIELENISNAAILERDLASVISSFAAQNAHLAVKSPSTSGAMVTQFVSNCNSTSGRYF